MIAFGSFIVIEAMALAGGLMLALDFVLLRPELNQSEAIISPIVYIGLGVGLLIGLAFAWFFKTLQAGDNRRRASSVPLWIAAPLAGYAMAGIVLFILSGVQGKPENLFPDWRIVAAAGLVGSVLGVIGGSLVSWRYSLVGAARPTLADLPMMNEPMEEVAAPRGRQASHTETLLSNEMLGVVRQHRNADMRGNVRLLGNTYVVQFEWQTQNHATAGCYIICGAGYPSESPRDVKIELNGQEYPHRYDLNRLHTAPRSDILGMVIRDLRGMLG